jgi:hypothetical protein
VAGSSCSSCGSAWGRRGDVSVGVLGVALVTQVARVG